MGANLYVCLIQNLVNLHYIQLKGNTAYLTISFLPKRPIVTVNRCVPFLPLIVKGVNLDVN